VYLSPGFEERAPSSHPGKQSTISSSKGMRATRTALPSRAIRTANSWVRHSPRACRWLTMFAQVSRRIGAAAARKACSPADRLPLTESPGEMMRAHYQGFSGPSDCDGRGRRVLSKEERLLLLRLLNKPGNVGQMNLSGAALISVWWSAKHYPKEYGM
jgi:hypothetical protein